MLNVFQSQENPVAVLTALIKKLKVRVSPETIKSCLQDHPDYPSLLAFSDCLTDWKVTNEAYRIDKADYDVNELSFPLLAHLKQSGGTFILIHQIKDGKVTYSDEKKDQAVMPEEEFLNQWDGIILYAQATAESGEQAYAAQQTKGLLNSLRLPALIVVALTGLVDPYRLEDIKYLLS